jgi:hypothetical protein
LPNRHAATARDAFGHFGAAIDRRPDGKKAGQCHACILSKGELSRTMGCPLLMGSNGIGRRLDGQRGSTGLGKRGKLFGLLDVRVNPDQTLRR